jgi:hypothetical protein
MKTPKISIFIGCLILISSIMACTLNIGGPDYPASSIPVSTEAAGELRTSLETAVAEGVASGQITLTFSETQLTSYLDYKFRSQSQLFFTDLQVYLRDGEIQIYGTTRQGYFEATDRIILSATVDEQDQIKIELVSADIGPLPIPDDLKDMVSSTIQEAFTGALGPVATGFRLLSITIADGTMTVVGQTK